MMLSSAVCQACVARLGLHTLILMSVRRRVLPARVNQGFEGFSRYCGKVTHRCLIRGSKDVCVCVYMWVHIDHSDCIEVR